MGYNKGDNYKSAWLRRVITEAAQRELMGDKDAS
jgi:hypothetical protein